MDKKNILLKVKTALIGLRKKKPTLLDLSEEELNWIRNLPMLNVKTRYTFSLDTNSEGRPILKMVDNYIKADPAYGLAFETHFVSDSNKAADGYNTFTIMMIVKMLNDYQTIQSISIS